MRVRLNACVLQNHGKRSKNHFFYDKQFDHTIWRLSDVKDISDASGDEESPKRLRFEDLTMIDGFSGLGTVAIAARASGMKVKSVLKEVYFSKWQERTQNGQCLFEALELLTQGMRKTCISSLRNRAVQLLTSRGTFFSLVRISTMSFPVE